MPIVDQTERNLKWRTLDRLEAVLSILCGLSLATFTVATMVNVAGRMLDRPLLWINELILGTFIWGIFLGAAVAVRRNAHFRLASFSEGLTRYWRLFFETVILIIVLACAVSVAVFGYVNFLQGFHNYLETTGTPIATITAAVPVFGALTVIFGIERLVNVWRVVLSSKVGTDAFEHLDPAREEGSI